MKEIKYVPIVLWDEKAKKLDFINASDFRKERLLGILGLSKSNLKESFGITDRAEILKRQRMIRFFIDNPELAETVMSMDPWKTGLPQEGQKFLNYFDSGQEHNFFWGMVNELVENIYCCKEVPPEISEWVKFLSSTKDTLEAEEWDMAKKAGEEIVKATNLEGYATYTFSMLGSFKLEDLKEGKVYGYRKYAYGLGHPFEKMKLPQWLFKKGFKKSGITNILQRIADWQEKKAEELRYSHLIVDYFPASIDKAIRVFLDERMKKVSRPEGVKYAGTVKFFFRYSREGLEIQLIDTQVELAEEVKKTNLFLENEGFTGYSFRQLAKIRKKNAAINGWIKTNLTEAARGKMLSSFERAIGNICSELVSVDKNCTILVDEEFAWYAVQHILSQPFVKDSCDRVVRYREHFHVKLEVLRFIAEIAITLKEKSEQWGKTLCFPNILEETEHAVMFKNLDPIHLLGEKKEKKHLSPGDLVPVNYLPALNGNMFVFTGQNAGGKSAAEEAIVNAIFMAQSGFPVFAEEFALNVKNTIGMVFLERGQGSTCELLLRKTKAVLESIEGASKNGVVLVLDEIGTGTQEVDGFDYGKRLLKKLSESHCSIISSTQITALAEYAKNDLNAFCFSFDSEHQIKPGIGTGGINKLMEDIGIEKMLN